MSRKLITYAISCFLDKRIFTQVFLRTAPNLSTQLERPLTVALFGSAGFCEAEFSSTLFMFTVVCLGMFLTYWSPQGEAKLNAIEATYGPRTKAQVWKICSVPSSKLEPIDVALIARRVGELKELNEPSGR